MVDAPTDTPPNPYEGLNEAERLGLLVGATYGEALAERDQAIQHLRTLVAAMPATSWAATNAAEEAARAWLSEYDDAKDVRSPETPNQETAGP